MRNYYIDELRPEELERLAERLENEAFSSNMPGLHWLPVPQSFLSAVQREHFGGCGPYSMALELLPDALKLEFLVRARNRLRCDCVAYAGPLLVAHMIGYLDGLLKELDIPT